MTEESTSTKAIVLLAMLPFLILYSIWAWAVVLVSTWNWFMVTTFQFQPIGFKQAIAIAAVVGLFFIRNNMANKVEKLNDGDFSWSRIGNSVCFALVAPWVTWCVYWITKAIFI